jgi:hypothetical protein
MKKENDAPEQNNSTTETKKVKKTREFKTKKRPYKKLDQENLERRMEKLSARMEKYKRGLANDTVIFEKYSYEKEQREQIEQK